MIEITPAVQMHFPIFTVTRDGCSVLYADEQQLTTAVGKRKSVGQPLPGYIGMTIVDRDGRLFSVTAATKGRDLGPLYPGLSLSRFLFGTRRVEANLKVAFLRQLSLEEGKDFVIEGFPSFRRSVEDAGGSPEALESAVRSAKSISDLMAVMKDQQPR
jgi:hypothetical protein